MYMPDFTMMMMNEESYSILLVTMKEAKKSGRRYSCFVRYKR